MREMRDNRRAKAVNNKSRAWLQKTGQRRWSAGIRRQTLQKIWKSILVAPDKRLLPIVGTGFFGQGLASPGLLVGRQKRDVKGIGGNYEDTFKRSSPGS